MITEILLSAFIIGISSGISAITGFGTSTISIPILINFFPYHQTLLFVGIIHCIGTIWKMYLFRSGRSINMLLKFGLPAMIASFFGALTSFSIRAEYASALLGSFLLGYLFFLLIWSEFTLKKSHLNLFSGGALSGFSSGIFGMGGAIRSVFLTAFDLPKFNYLFTTNAIAFLVDIARLSTYYSGNMILSYNLLIGLVLSLPFSFVCTWYAKKIVVRIEQHHFRLLVAVVLGITGLKLLVWG